MKDLLDAFLPWIFSWQTVVHGFCFAALVAVAFWCNKTGAASRFFLIAALAFLAVAIPVVSTSPSARSALAGAAWLLSIAAVYAAVLGLMVSKRARLRSMIGVSVILFLVQVPFSLFSALALACTIGHDCV